MGLVYTDLFNLRSIAKYARVTNVVAQIEFHSNET